MGSMMTAPPSSMVVADLCRQGVNLQTLTEKLSASQRLFSLQCCKASNSLKMTEDA